MAHSVGSCGRIRGGYGVGAPGPLRPLANGGSRRRSHKAGRRRTERGLGAVVVAKAAAGEGESKRDDIVFESEQITKSIRAKVQEKLKSLNERNATTTTDLETYVFVSNSSFTLHP